MHLCNSFESIDHKSCKKDINEIHDSFYNFTSLNSQNKNIQVFLSFIDKFIFECYL